MEKKYNNKQINTIKHTKQTNNQTNKKNNFKLTNFPVKIYFPTISLHAIREIIDQNNKLYSKSFLSKYLIDEKNKIIIYGDTGIFEMLNNNLHQLYPIDLNVNELIINNNLKILIDSSYFKRSEYPSYQIPYYHIIKNRIIKTYKMNINSKLKFIIEIEKENHNICDFYMIINMNDITNNENNEIEINKFVKDEIMSFLFGLNLYR